MKSKKKLRQRKKVHKGNLVYKTDNYTCCNIYNGKNTLNDADEDRSSFLVENMNFKRKTT